MFFRVSSYLPSKKSEQLVAAVNFDLVWMLIFLLICVCNLIFELFDNTGAKWQKKSNFLFWFK